MTHRSLPRSVALLCGAWFAIASTPSLLFAQADETKVERIHHEVPADPPGPTETKTSPALNFGAGPYVSVQVNVDSNGNNINNDAANEPSIAVDFQTSSRIVIGWRQFNSISSNFRQAGVSYSHDAGTSWTFPGVIEPGIFRSDPVLGSDENGDFHYMSLTQDSGGNFVCDLFGSTDGGITWTTKTPMFGGDKNWMAIDRFTGNQHFYGIWQRFFGCCGADTITRSTDGGTSFQTPLFIPESPTFGNMNVATDGTLYIAGIQADDQVGQNLDQFVVARSTNADESGQTPTFATAFVNLGGSMRLGTGPNPSGLLGQANVAADPQNPSRVYALCSVNPPGSDPMDVNIARSEDGGQTWTSPITVNNDSGNAWQWLGTLSVAPDGRVDVAWVDTRNSGGNEEIGELFYAFSYDFGETWIGNEAAGPPWDSTLGWPNQAKIGDYYDMVSDNSVGHLAYAATYNGEQDVYYVRLFPDCNNNGTPDFDDIHGGGSTDVDADRLPDDCESFTLAASPLNPDLGDTITFDLDNGFPSTPGYLFVSAINGSPQLIPLIQVTFSAGGKASVGAQVPNDNIFSGIDFSIVGIGLFLDGAARISAPVDISIQ